MNTTSEAPYTMTTETATNDASGDTPDLDLLAEQIANGDPGDLLRSLIEQRIGQDPRLRLFASLLARRDAQAAEQAPAAAVSRSQREARRRETIAELTQELMALRRLNDIFAAALGACRLCWGRDDQCQRCDGQGVIGYFMPDSGLFQQWIEPAMARLSRGPARSQAIPNEERQC